MNVSTSINGPACLRTSVSRGLDMMAELKTAAIVAKAVAKDPTAMHAKEVGVAPSRL